jgi:hypothetical protein
MHQYLLPSYFHPPRPSGKRDGLIALWLREKTTDPHERDEKNGRRCSGGEGKVGAKDRGGEGRADRGRGVCIFEVSGHTPIIFLLIL